MKTKYIYIATLITCMAFFLSGCEGIDTGRVEFPFSSPEISNLNYSFTSQAEAGDSIFFSIDITDPLTPLSTLEVSVTSGEDDQEVYSESIRTKGNSFQIKNHGIYIPFNAGFEEKLATLTLTAINVEGSEKTEVKTFTVKRPELPSTIYLHYNGETVPMSISENNPFVYETESGEYPEIFEGKISTSPTLEESKFIWGYTESNNVAGLVAPTGANFIFNNEFNIIEKVLFNTFSFELDYEGISTLITVNGIQLEQNNEGLFEGEIQFTQNGVVEVTGILDLNAAYNRDFFSYDNTSGELVFLRNSGSWTVYYSMKYNYMWIARPNDVAPDAFWLVGHGFTSASQWHSDFGYGGWDVEDITRLGYIVKIGDNKYQATVYLNNDHEWGSFEIEVYSNREWGKDDGMLLSEGLFSGDKTGITESASNGLTNSDGFVPGYYKLTFDTSGGVGSETLTIERLSQ